VGGDHVLDTTQLVPEMLVAAVVGFHYRRRRPTGQVGWPGRFGGGLVRLFDRLRCGSILWLLDATAGSAFVAFESVVGWGCGRFLGGRFERLRGQFQCGRIFCQLGASSRAGFISFDLAVGWHGRRVRFGGGFGRLRGRFLCRSMRRLLGARGRAVFVEREILGARALWRLFRRLAGGRLPELTEALPKRATLSHIKPHDCIKNLSRCPPSQGALSMSAV
jgi:hypothetical protein